MTLGTRWGTKVFSLGNRCSIRLSYRGAVHSLVYGDAGSLRTDLGQPAASIGLAVDRPRWLFYYGPCFGARAWDAIAGVHRRLGPCQT